MQIVDQNLCRKIDAQGRVIIPKSLRDQFGWNVGDDINFYLIFDNGTPMYAAFRSQADIDPKYEVAASVLEELGVKLPQELIKKITGDKE